METIKIKKGLDLPLAGEPVQKISDTKLTKSVAILGDDYNGMKPTMHVRVGDSVKKGQVLFNDKKLEEIKYTSPICGIVKEVNRGEKRKFISIVIEQNGNDEITFDSYDSDQIEHLDKTKIQSQLIESGVWTAIRVRPFEKVADPKVVPHSIFVTAIDSNPLAPSIDAILEGQENNFESGLRILSKLTDGKINICKSSSTIIKDLQIDNLQVINFEGPHPSGNVGTHIHFVDPVGRNKLVWHVGIQDVIVIGALFSTGKIDSSRIIALTGPAMSNPRLIKTTVGADITELVQSEISELNHTRVISGSVLFGHSAQHPTCFLGRYHQQVTALPEGDKREFLGWLIPSTKLFSVKNILLSSINRKKKINLSTSTNGGERAIVPVGSYEKVMPLDIMPTFLLRSLAVHDVEEAEKLGCLELSEEDLALCTFVCPSKLDHGKKLRETLNIIEKEG